MSIVTQRLGGLAQRLATRLHANAHHARRARVLQHLSSSSEPFPAVFGLQFQRCHFHSHSCSSHTHPFACTCARHFSSSSKDNETPGSSAASVPSPLSSADSEDALKESFSDVPGVESPGEKFVMLYTCVVCETRSAKSISKQAYHKGVVLVRCPGCEKLHLIADRLGWFDDESVDVESILAARGETVRVATHENVLELTDVEILGKMRKDE